MFLEKIEMKGFKSFARSLEIEFESPLTAIVGPNGSGKSNIVDAVRWVLGEQSAKSLRGSRMADVIFAGSEGHKPSQKATVTLHLNNENNYLSIDMDQLSLSRTVNEEGYSDYYLNGSPCRLKDIEELLMDTGLGKNSYSIVSQGQISSIINSSPGRLRELFEESAGISRHKARKAETEKKLENNKKDLQRISDLITELKKQLPAIEKEAQKAKKYKKNYSQLKLLEINLLQNKWYQQKKELQELKEDYETFSTQLVEQKDTFSNFKQELTDKKESLEEREQQSRELRDEYYKLQSKKEETGNKIEILKEKKRALKKEKSDKKQQSVELQKGFEQLCQDQKQLQEAVESLVNEKNELQKKETKLEQEINGLIEKTKKDKEKINNLRDNIYQPGDLDDLRSERTRITEKIDHTRKSTLKNLKEYLHTVEQNRKLTEDIKQQLADISRTQQQITELNENIEGGKEKRLQLNKTINNLRQKYDTISEKYNLVESRLSVLQEREKNYKGFFEGVKNILQKKDEFPGVIDAVVNLLEVEEKLEKATACVLGNRLQNVVVRHDREARKCIEYLKKNNGGQATLLPLNMIKPHSNKGERGLLQRLEGFIGFGCELITVDEEFDILLNYLLGSVIYARDLKTAVEISKKTSGSYKIVSLAGEVISPGGAITGGSSRNRQQQFLEREREIKELQKQLQRIGREKKQFEDRLDDLEQQREANRKNINQKSQELQERELDLSKKMNHVHGYKKDIKKNITILENCKHEYFSGVRDLLQFRDEKAALQQQIIEADKKFELEKKKIKEIEQKIESAEQKVQSLQEKKTKIQIEIASREQKLKDHRETIKERGTAAEKKRQKSKAHQQRISEIETEQQEYRKKIKLLIGQKNEFASRCLQAKNDLQELEEELAREKKKVNSLEKQVQPAREKLERYQEDLHKLELKINRLENSQQQISEKLAEKYEFTVGEDSPEETISIDNKKKVERKIKGLKKKLQGLQPVNRGAVKEYRELKERVKYLQEQREDLLAARKSLNKIIAEIENNMGRLFHETYQEVKKQFEDIFQELFEGGRAELKLTSPDDYLETGVEIEAQPPGKQLKELSLLSGGERALTAIALVFAFLNVNPSPLYILDEIDAPLDDINLVKFANFIDDYSAIAQFIIITHRKYMMSRMETLYGVTMEEKGISRVFSLKLEEEGAEFVKN